MITRFVFALTLGTALLPGLFAAPKPSICGTSRGKWREELVLHDHAARLRKGLALRGAVTGAAAAGRDAGNIAVLEDDGNLVIRRKPFNLDERTISFQPAAGFRSYRYLVSGPGFDRAAAQEGIPLDRPADDGAILIRIPFEFPLFGNFYNEAYADSDGNIQFGSSSSGGDRSLGQLLAGAPRVAPLLTDLDPTSGGSIRVYSDAGRVVISWVDVPEYSDYGFGRVQNFQVRLYADGRIEFAYSGVTLENAIVGIAPGGGEEPVLVDFFADPSGPGGSAIAEVFSDSERVDMVSVARRFFQSHDDSYDYLMVYNNMGVTALDAVAYELPVRTTGQGFGDEPVDVGASYGSRRRLQAVINMGPLSQYPTNPDAHVLARGPTRDTPVSIMAHEAGHLFLAYVSVPDADNPGFLPMLGYQSAHWAFTFNSEASLLEGNRIRDDGEGRTPRFLTVDNVQAYAPLDQYLMGFRAPRDVPPTFVITSPSVGTGYRVPQSGVSINGGRRDITVEDEIAASGPRVPDHTVAQRHFRFGIILLVPAAVQTPQQAIDKVEAYRQRFEAFYHQASSENGWADTAIRKSVTASVAPAAGVVAGASITASLSLEARAESDLVFRLSAGAGGIAVPETVTQTCKSSRPMSSSKPSMRGSKWRNRRRRCGWKCRRETGRWLWMAGR
ncbi:MAG: hypothetical protein NTY38_26070 [Acidobacteria bacterium]|nr:hypothetical protein [Acidobacteriota bacterium]